MLNYPIPLDLAQVTRGKRVAIEEDVKKSIHQNINLILKTMSLSYRFDPSFGSILNKFQAATPPQKVPERIWREQMRESIQKNLKDMLRRYETRIRVKDVYIDMKKPKRGDKAIVNVQVMIDGHLMLGRKENFHYPDSEVSEEAQEVFPLMIPVGKMK